MKISNILAMSKIKRSKCNGKYNQKYLGFLNWKDFRMFISLSSLLNILDPYKSRVLSKSTKSRCYRVSVSNSEMFCQIWHTNRQFERHQLQNFVVIVQPDWRNSAPFLCARVLLYECQKMDAILRLPLFDSVLGILLAPSKKEDSYV